MVNLTGSLRANDTHLSPKASLMHLVPLIPECSNMYVIEGVRTYDGLVTLGSSPHLSAPW